VALPKALADGGACSPRPAPVAPAPAAGLASQIRAAHGQTGCPDAKRAQQPTLGHVLHTLLTVNHDLRATSRTPLTTADHHGRHLHCWCRWALHGRAHAPTHPGRCPGHLGPALCHPGPGQAQLEAAQLGQPSFWPIYAPTARPASTPAWVASARAQSSRLAGTTWQAAGLHRPGPRASPSTGGPGCWESWGLGG
jgi:hypothetical protein